MNKVQHHDNPIRDAQSKILQSHDFKCAACGLDCSALKIETAVKNGPKHHIELTHMSPICESFTNQTQGEFMRAVKKTDATPTASV